MNFVTNFTENTTVKNFNK